MKQYYIQEGKNKLGPFNLEELENQQINSKTLIWVKGLKDWTPATKIEELKVIIENSPPPIVSYNPVLRSAVQFKNVISKPFLALINKLSSNPEVRENVVGILILLAILIVITLAIYFLSFETIFSFACGIGSLVLGYGNIYNFVKGYSKDVIYGLLLGPFEIVLGLVFLYSSFKPLWE